MQMCAVLVVTVVLVILGAGVTMYILVEWGGYDSDVGVVMRDEVTCVEDLCGMGVSVVVCLVHGVRTVCLSVLYVVVCIPRMVEKFTL